MPLDDRLSSVIGSLSFGLFLAPAEASSYDSWAASSFGPNAEMWLHEAIDARQLIMQQAGSSGA